MTHSEFKTKFGRRIGADWFQFLCLTLEGVETNVKVNRVVNSSLVYEIAECANVRQRTSNLEGYGFIARIQSLFKEEKRSNEVGLS